MSLSPLISRLIADLRHLPGVGPKSAQRMAFYLLERDRAGARHLAASLVEAMDKVGHCRECRTLCESELCALCANPKRNRQHLCIVETPADVYAIDQATGFQGRYFVLLGHLSPLDGIGPEDIGLDILADRLAQGGIEEIILATNPTVEGEATAHYIAQLAQAKKIKATRIAFGVPLGGELEYVDSETLSRAFQGKREI
ncbi:MAG: recombination protein RecR [Gammaproteobacteria bacterium RBG_16_57_12]|nr:MAG: recombination protein RecR [Gammaproteobacteria bacterium RBG_16_57_12]